ncbi:hypothetical protein B0O80DRAFT_495511 [Mortierella sp. GBAus27b]|nr:hypothetical protein B0O80DRAFT_495511 [Mortierella sp. GBAus27b]
MSERTCIFDLPHITDLIGSHLNRRDLSSCIRVNKVFYEHFVSILWTELDFRPYTRLEKYTIDDHSTKEEEEAWIRNCHWTRDVTMASNCIDHGMLTRLLTCCTRLKTLKCTNSVTNHWSDSSLTQVLQLVQNNTRLERWELLSCHTLSTRQLVQLSNVVWKSPCLTDLKLDLLFHPRPGWLQLLLKSLPASLKRLHVNWGYLYEGSDEDEQFVLPCLEWPERYPSLEVMNMAIFLPRAEEHHFFEFLKRCPALTTLSLPSIVAYPSYSSSSSSGNHGSESHAGIDHLVRLLGSKVLFPQLCHLDICRLDELDDDQSKQLLRAMQGRIKTFAAESIDSVHELIAHWSNTIESLQFHHLCISPRDLCDLITGCQRLQKLECSWPSWNQQDHDDTSPWNSGEEEEDLDTVEHFWINRNIDELRQMFSCKMASTQTTTTTTTLKESRMDQ